jgi:3-deoxy-D-manno-octulosonic-acid transferase
LGPGFPLFPFPLDAYGGPRRAIRRLKPDLIVILETELWPNFLREAHRAGVRTMLANGRISPRSYKNYQKVRFLFGEVLGYLDRLAMIRTGDADRVIGLGADPGRTLVAGNAKYDLLMAKADPDRAARLAVRLGPLGPGPVWVAGSTREGEEKIIMDVFSTLRAEFPGLHLILAPRHVGRSDRIESRIAGAGWRVRRWSRPDAGGGSDVTLVDAMGDLFHLYARADAAFIGGSLVPLGGQNPLEPAVWGRPMLFGPHMEDFEDAVALLDSHGAGRKVQDGADLARTLADLFRRPDQARDLGQRGKQALAGHRGAADRLAEQALDLIGAAAGAGHEREPVL